MRYVFAILLGIHALIHLIGFVSAFFSTEISKQLLGISKPIGSLWLVTFILFIVTASQFLDNKKWFYIAFIAVLLSQILIIITWGDAKYGTIVNSIILLVSLSAFGNHRFEEMVERETKNLLVNKKDLNIRLITQEDINELPEIVQLWLKKSGVLGAESITSVRLEQQGLMRIKPNGKWMPFEATQCFNTLNPSFVWSTRVNAMPIISMVGRDKLVNGEGEMLIKLAGLIPIVNESGNNKINSGAMLRYLAETCWFPQATINDYLKWETINSTSAKATLIINKESVSGIFKFNIEGELLSFEANRYYGGAENSKLEKWVIETLSFKVFEGIKIPKKSKVTWNLEDGDFNWLTIEVIDLKYNVLGVY